MTFIRFSALSRRRLIGGLGAAVLGAAAPPGALPAFAGTSRRPSGRVTALAFDQGALVLAAAGIWTSPDGGANLLPRSQGPGAPVAALAAHPDRPGMLLAATASVGLMRSEDGGSSWHPAAPGLPAAPLDAVAIATHDPLTLYVAVRGDGLWQSNDGGKSWDFAMDRPLVDKVEVDVQALASVGSLSGMGGYWVYAGTAKGASRVPDCFCRWQTLESADAMTTGTAKPAPVDPAPRLPHLSVTSLTLAPSVPEVLFAGLPSGVWRTRDSGSTWKIVNGALTSPLLAVDPLDPNHVVAADAGGTILSSRDGGATWAAPSAA
ncbi:MAG TPA: hypothetical protein PLI43_15720 [Albidovulum sp.]|uniref:sialidase family protein n=1 Tax=Albidovulum sp. TaxID=1872424 RepID=UPI002C6C83D5|nr:hypothetical protein [Albidovulum sp.]